MAYSYVSKTHTRDKTQGIYSKIWDELVGNDASTVHLRALSNTCVIRYRMNLRAQKQMGTQVRLVKVSFTAVAMATITLQKVDLKATQTIM